MLNWKIYLYLGIALAFIALGGWAWSTWQEYQALKFQHSLSLQNQQALQDSLTVAAGKMTIITAQVRDLKAENTVLKKKNIALQVQNQILLDSLKAEGDTTAVIQDSTATVSFGGRRYFMTFTGKTITNLLSKQSRWSLSAEFDEIKTKSTLFQDNDGLWKIQTLSLTEGARVKGISTIDDDTFAALQKYSPPTPPKNFGLNLQASTSDFWGGVIFRYNDRWYLNINYRLTHLKPEWSDNLLAGVSFFVF